MKNIQNFIWLSQLYFWKSKFLSEIQNYTQKLKFETEKNIHNTKKNWNIHIYT